MRADKRTNRRKSVTWGRKSTAWRESLDKTAVILYTDNRINENRRLTAGKEPSADVHAALEEKGAESHEA